MERRKKSSLCYNTKLTAINVTSQSRKMFTYCFANIAVPSAEGDRPSEGVCSAVEGAVTQVTGVQDMKTKCDQSCSRREEEVVNSSWGSWAGFMGSVHFKLHLEDK